MRGVGTGPPPPVQDVFGPRERTCVACGRTEVTAAAACPHCGKPYVLVAQRLSRTAKRRIGLGLALGLLAIFTAGIVASPSITENKEEARKAGERARAVRQAQARRRAAGEQRPVSADPGPAARPVLVKRLADYVLRDARARVESGKLKGPVRRSFCSPYPNTATRRAQESDPRRARGRYECTVVTSEIRGANGERGTLGYPFSAVIEYRTGRMTWCKANPPPGEKGIGSERARVALDPSCSRA